MQVFGTQRNVAQLSRIFRVHTVREMFAKSHKRARNSETNNDDNNRWGCAPSGRPAQLRNIVIIANSAAAASHRFELMSSRARTCICQTNTTNRGHVDAMRRLTTSAFAPKRVPCSHGYFQQWDESTHTRTDGRTDGRSDMCNYTCTTTRHTTRTHVLRHTRALLVPVNRQPGMSMHIMSEHMRLSNGAFHRVEMIRPTVGRQSERTNGQRCQPSAHLQLINDDYIRRVSLANMMSTHKGVPKPVLIPFASALMLIPYFIPSHYH